MLNLTYIKKIIDIKFNGKDDVVEEMIASARIDLITSGISPVKANADDDSLITRAVALYCRYHFRMTDKDAERYLKAYESLKIHLSLCEEYKNVAI